MDKCKGPATRYRPKAPPGKSVSLTDLAKRALAAAAVRAVASESDVVEHLIRLHAGGVTPEELAPIRETAA